MVNLFPSQNPTPFNTMTGEAKMGCLPGIGDIYYDLINKVTTTITFEQAGTSHSKFSNFKDQHVTRL